jgi:SAM-dependent methyltransferase
MGADDTYGQQRAMEDPTMVGTLQTQIDMIWPLERPLLERLGLPAAKRLADLACGTGRFVRKVAETWPEIEIDGVDLFEGHLAIARRDLPAAAWPRVHLHQGDARATGRAAGAYDVVTIRHVLQAVGDPPAFLAEARRLLRPGGRLYTLVEDYQGLLVDARTEAGRRLFLDAEPRVRGAGTHLFHGRGAPRELLAAGFEDVRVEAIVVDTCNTPRSTFAAMMRFWRDGYVTFLSEHLQEDPATTRARFDDLIDCIEDPTRWAGWWLLAVSGVAP